MHRTILPRLSALAAFTVAISSRAQTAPMVLTASEATPSAHITDVVHPAKHPDYTLIGPYQIRRFYHLENVKNLGEGQTIALIGAFHDPNLDHDLAVFSQRFGLPQCTLANKCLRQIDTAGGDHQHGTQSLTTKRTRPTATAKKRWTWSGRTRSRRLHT